MKKIVQLIYFTTISLALLAQENKPFTSSISGYVKNDVFYDTRETVSARDGHFLLWPSPIALDSSNTDMNNIAQLNMLAIQSRITFRFSGPDVLGAHTSGLIEGDFFGNASINSLRLRHAFVKLNWEHTELISGQYWNPLFVTSCFPGTISFNTGTPFNSFARNPQLRITHTLGNISFTGALLSQVDNVSRSINNTKSSTYLRQSVIPDAHLQFAYATKNDSTQRSFTCGGGIAYKQITPRNTSTVDSIIYTIDESVKGLTAVVFSKIQTSLLTIKISMRYGENIPDITAPGGFAVKNVSDTITGKSEYTPLTSLSYWGEIHTNGDYWEFGVFGGLFTNTGTKEKMNSATNPVYGLATNITRLYRVSPRVMYTINKFRVGLEYEYTGAVYGKNFNANYKAHSLSDVSNSRILFTTVYSF
ncbi:MAG: hypothetical protein PF481_03410 [Bacteroidales bacterium]|jgi:hypothetical protein|nr:hypothetical protein [Bacteroidales bacterium]